MEFVVCQSESLAEQHETEQAFGQMHLVINLPSIFKVSTRRPSEVGINGN